MRITFGQVFFKYKVNLLVIYFLGFLFQIQAVVDSLEEFRHTDGRFLRPFLEQTENSDFYFVQLKTRAMGRQQRDKREQFNEDRHIIITEIIKHIRGRFPQLDMLDAMKVSDRFITLTVFFIVFLIIKTSYL